MISPNKNRMDDSDVKFEISDNQDTDKKQQWNDAVKRFSILQDIDQLNQHLNKKQKTEQDLLLCDEQQPHKKKKSSYSDELMRKTLQLTYQYNQTGDRILKLNLSERQQSKNPQQDYESLPLLQAASTSQFQNQKPLSNQPKKPFRYIEDSEPKSKQPTKQHQSKQTSCQTVVVRNPRMYKQIREINLLKEPEIKCNEDFSHQLYQKNYSNKQNTQYNLFSKAIETERMKDYHPFLKSRKS